MALRFTTTAEAAKLQGIKCLVYARAGIGKTTLCATAPAPLIISAEAGLLSLRKWDIPVIEILNLDDLKDAFNWVEGSKEADQFATICLDSSTEIAEKVLAHAKASAKDPRQAYGDLLDQMLDTLKKFRDLKGKHVYISAKEIRQKDEGTGMLLAGPMMPGQKLGPAMPYLFDEVFHLGIAKTPEGTDYRYFKTQPDFQYDAKDRSGALDPVEPPDLTHVFNKIMGS